VTAKGRALNLIAVVDDDESIRLALIPALQSIGLTAVGFDSAESFIEYGRLSEVACLITDLRMPGMNGLELQAKLRREGYHFPTVFMTAHGMPEVRSQAMAAGAVAFFDKPFDADDLLEAVRKIIEKR
jgi:FixJ family two-component response regulator